MAEKRANLLSHIRFQVLRDLHKGLDTRTFLVLVVAGQIITAVLADHYGVMGLGGKPLSLARVAGVVLILCGVLLVQGTWATAPATSAITTVKQPEG